MIQMPASLRVLRTTCAAALAACLLLPAGAEAEQVTIFAAASLKTALDDFQKSYEAETGDSLAISYAGSSQLARQIEQGAPAQVFISANVEWMDALQKAELIDTASRHDLLGNSLVLVAGGAGVAKVTVDGQLDLVGLLGDGKLAMALVDSVPAGQYGKAALTSLGLWDAVAPHVAQADNVRAALALVSTGEAPYGIVYATDAAADPGVGVAGTFPEGSHPPIIYPAALVKGADAHAAAFLAALSGPEAVKAFEAQGFTILTPAAKVSGN